MAYFCSVFCVGLMGVATAGFLTSPYPLNAQTTAPASQNSPLTIHLVMKNGRVPFGKSPDAILVMQNNTDRTIPDPTDVSIYRVQVDRVSIAGESGKVSKTAFYRRISGDVLPGETPIASSGGITHQILPDTSLSREFSLGEFYDLELPGRYAVYIEVQDASGQWLRTNTSSFEIDLPAK